MTQLDPQVASAVRELITVLKTRATLSKQDRHQLYDPLSRRAINRMFETGAT